MSEERTNDLKKYVLFVELNGFPKTLESLKDRFTEPEYSRLIAVSQAPLTSTSQDRLFLDAIQTVELPHLKSGLGRALIFDTPPMYWAAILSTTTATMH